MNTNTLASIKTLNMLATDNKHQSSQDAEGLHVAMPEKAVGKYDYVLKVPRF